MDIRPAEKASSPDGEGSKDKQREQSTVRVRRRNRMITSCLECRRRKLKCDKQQPCTNCMKFSRECNFLAPALDSVSQKKLNEIKEKMGSLERTLEEDVARRKSEDRRKAGRRASADLPGEGSESDEGLIPEDERGLEATPMATVDAIYEDDGETDDEVLDLGFRVGKFRMTERLGGLFRPKLAEEMIFTLVRDNKRGTEPEAPLRDDPETFLEPGPTYIAPGSGFVFGDTGHNHSIVNFLPTKTAGDLLLKRYYNNVHSVARVVHMPSFQAQYDKFWIYVLSGIEPAASLQALVFAVYFSAIASISNSEVDSIFQQSHRRVLTNFQQGTEVALGKANFLRTTKFETLQGLIIYLIPMCRGELSRAHSVLVGAAIRLGECFSLHRDPVDAFGLAPIEAHVRRIAWFQLCYLDFRTAESQGPRPSIKREEYDTKMPWNLDDADLMEMQPTPDEPTIDLKEKERQWTDVTLSKIRFECCEMHRIVWHDRNRLDKGKVSITHCLSKIEAFRSAMEDKYSWLDTSITIQHYTRILLDMLLLRMHIMILHKYQNSTSTRIPDRLRQIVIGSGVRLTESAIKLDIDPKFESFKWYVSALQQWHTAFLLVCEVFVYPNRKEAERIWSIADHVFEPDLTLPRVQKARSILGAIRDRAAAYQKVRKMGEPLSMRNRLQTQLPARARLRGPDMIVPVGQRPNQPGETSASRQISQQHSNTMQTQAGPASNMATTNEPQNMPDQSNLRDPVTDRTTQPGWTFDAPFTPFTSQAQSQYGNSLSWYNLKTRQASTSAATSPPYATSQHLGEPSPSSSSQYTEQWPPSISNVQQATYHYSQYTTPPPHNTGFTPEDSNSPPPLYGNTALGVVSGEYMPATAQHPMTAANSLVYNENQAPAMTGPMTSEQIGPSGHHISASTSYSQQVMAPADAMRPAAQPQQSLNQQDAPMLDINWAEWDKLFPPDMNTGELDWPVEMQHQQ